VGPARAAHDARVPSRNPVLVDENTPRIDRLRLACYWAELRGSFPAMLLAELRTLSSALQSQRALAVENLALRHQLGFLQRPSPACIEKGSVSE